MRSCEANGTWSGNITTCKSKNLKKTLHLTRLQSSITTSPRGARGDGKVGSELDCTPETEAFFLIVHVIFSPFDLLFFHTETKMNE